MSPAREQTVAATTAFLAHPRFVAALTAMTVGFAVFAFPIKRLIGDAGLIGSLTGLVMLAVLSIIARRKAIQWNGLLPLSLLIFLVWAALTVNWSRYPLATLLALLSLAAYTLLALYIALLRDTVQIMRAFGDVLRVAMGVSIGLEILSGVIIDTPLNFLAITGNLAVFGPIQGIAGTRNSLGILALIALITFAIENQTKSIRRGLAVGSLLAAGLVLTLSRSPVAIGGLIVVIAASAALFAIRRSAPKHRRYWQFSLIAATLLLAVIAWLFRFPIVQALNAGGELNYRLELWHQAWRLIRLHPLDGWGWIGAWRTDQAPYSLFAGISARTETSAANAFIDVWLQLGLVGLVIFVVLIGVAFTRSWLLASQRKSIVFVWLALILIATLTTTLAESSILIEFGWLTLIVCAVRAAEQLSWRQALASVGGLGDPTPGNSRS